MNLMRQTFSDIKLGTLRGTSWKIIVIIMAFVSSVRCQSGAGWIGTWSMEAGKLRFADYLLYFYKGYNFYELGAPMIPLWYLVTCSIFLASVLNYPWENIREGRYMGLLNSRKASIWWTAKMFWCVIHAFCFQICVYLGIMMFCLKNGESLTGKPTTESLRFVLSWFIGEERVSESSQIARGELFLILVVIPVLGMSILLALQIFLQMYVRAVFAFLLCLFLCMVSYWWGTSWLPGNSLLLARSEVFAKDGMEIGKEVMVLLGYFIFLCKLGGVLLKKKDLLPTEE